MRETEAVKTGFMLRGGRRMKRTGNLKGVEQGARASQGNRRKADVCEKKAREAHHRSAEYKKKTTLRREKARGTERIKQSKPTEGRFQGSSQRGDGNLATKPEKERQSGESVGEVKS